MLTPSQLLEATSTTGTKTYPNATYESLEALLIAHSPAYVQAMTREIERRFAEGDFGQADEPLAEGEHEETKARLLAGRGPTIWRRQKRR
jgi:hypothetical protein